MAWLDRVLFRLRMIKSALTLPRIAGAEDEPPEDPPKDDPPKDDPPDDEPVKPDDDWKAKARKHETAAKRERKEREKLAAELKKLQEADQSEHEKAIAKAREEAKSEAQTEFEKERRTTRLESAVTRFAARGFQIGEGDDAETVKFADPDDALVYIDRGIARGEIDGDEIFDDEGRVNESALKSALAELLERKTHLRADAERGGKPKGDPDRGKGKPAGKTAEDRSIAELDKELRTSPR